MTSTPADEKVLEYSRSMSQASHISQHAPRFRDHWISMIVTRALRLRECHGIDKLIATARAEQCLGNLHGLDAHLTVAEWALGLRSVESKFVGADGTQVTVDVVACDGLWWIEIKATTLFGLESSAWASLRDQASRLLRVAAQHRVGAHSPRVLVVFTAGCTVEVATALSRLGCAVVHAAPRLPPPICVASALGLPVARASRAAVLDLSTLLALVADSTHVPPNTPALRLWASGNEHWSSALAEEAVAPLLPELNALLRAHSPWLVLCAHARRLDARLRQAGGPSERQRWEALLEGVQLSPSPVALAILVNEGDGKAGVRTICKRSSKLRVDVQLTFRCDELGGVRASVVGARCSCVESTRLEKGSGNGHSAPPALSRGTPCESDSLVLSALRDCKLSEEAKQLVSLASAHDATLFTANAKMLRRLPPVVSVERFVHAPRWLSGAATARAHAAARRLQTRSLARRRQARRAPDSNGASAAEPSGASFASLPAEVITLILEALAASDLSAALRAARTCRAARSALRHVQTVRVAFGQSAARSGSVALRYWAPASQSASKPAHKIVGSELRGLCAALTRLEAASRLSVAGALNDEAILRLCTAAAPHAASLRSICFWNRGGRVGPDGVEYAAALLRRSGGGGEGGGGGGNESGEGGDGDEGGGAAIDCLGNVLEASETASSGPNAGTPASDPEDVAQAAIVASSAEATGACDFALAHVCAGASGAAALADALRRTPALRTLRLHHCGLLKSDVQEIARALTYTRIELTVLSLRQNRIGASGAICLAGWLRTDSRCLALDLTKCAVRSTGALALCLALTEDSSAFTEMVARAVAAGTAIARETAATIEQWRAQHQDAAAEGRVHGARSRRRMGALMLADNSLGDVAAAAVGVLVGQGEAAPRRIDVSHNGFTATGLSCLVGGIDKALAVPFACGFDELRVWPLRDPRECHTIEDVDSDAARIGSEATLALFDAQMRLMHAREGKRDGSMEAKSTARTARR